MQENDVKIEALDPSLFEFVQYDSRITDTKMATKRIGYFKDAMIRFCRNKASIVAACIILFMVLFAIIAPEAAGTTYTRSRGDNDCQKYQLLLPKNNLFKGSGFWDGTKNESVNSGRYNQYVALGIETGLDPIAKLNKKYKFNGLDYYNVRVDTYNSLGLFYMTFTLDQYQAIQKYQDENNLQIIFPAVTSLNHFATLNDNSAGANIWYEHKENGTPDLKNGKYVDIYRKASNGYTYDDDYTSKMRISSDDGTYKYAVLSGTAEAPSFYCRVLLYNYFIYKYGYEPCFAFGTDGHGYDIFTRLGSGARLSFLLAIFVASINLVIGAIWGSISGYFGGAADLIMERITDVLGNIPFMIVTTLFQLHLASKVGVIPSLLLAFVVTGWIGTASTVRMQFYRYKNQEYVLAARTLGAKNKRLMFKHIFPNALGTIITSSVLVIPSVIFSESSLTYLGIVNLDGDSQTSIGTMLANSRTYLTTFPHVILFPAIFISLLMITFNLFGNGLRDAFNPSLRGTED
ncbi:MAG: ABC transporter permease [Anaeroplasmataceae bacterium]|nr:ABC transporter permease [Anaeroplasmataceae bacterium]